MNANSCECRVACEGVKIVFVVCCSLRGLYPYHGGVYREEYKNETAEEEEKSSAEKQKASEEVADARRGGGRLPTTTSRRAPLQKTIVLYF